MWPAGVCASLALGCDCSIHGVWGGCYRAGKGSCLLGKPLSSEATGLGAGWPACSGLSRTFLVLALKCHVLGTQSFLGKLVQLIAPDANPTLRWNCWEKFFMGHIHTKFVCVYVWFYLFFWDSNVGGCPVLSFLIWKPYCEIFAVLLSVKKEGIYYWKTSSGGVAGRFSLSPRWEGKGLWEAEPDQ